jgi:peptidoglycan/xylan/chitin deacetylase (PgdA/CDA1 family)
LVLTAKVLFMTEAEKPQFSRRNFLKMSGVAAVGLLVDKVFPGRVLAQSEQKPASREEEAPIQIRQPIFWGNRNRPEVALTFDDGFSRSSVAASLKVLRASGAQTTFFVIGRQLRAYPDLWQEAMTDGHEICNHTYSHSYLTTLSSEQVKKEIFLWEESAKEVLGEEYLIRMKDKCPYIRFPGGAGHKDERILRTVAEAGYWPIAWSADTYHAVLRHYNLRTDPVLPIAQEVADHIVNTSRYGSIPLLHFNVWDVTRLEEMVEGIERKGLQITTVSRVLREDPKMEEEPKLEEEIGQSATGGGLKLPDPRGLVASDLGII